MDTLFDKKLFKDNVCSLKKTSRDTDGTEPGYMTDSEMEVINFDRVKEDYIKGMKLSITPCSNDALYIRDNEHIYFVEFKNGYMNNKKIYNVYTKIYDSLLIFNDIVDKNISFCREHVNYILVYNESKNPDKSVEIKNEDSSKAMIGKYFHKKAKKKYVRFDLERFEKLYFKEVFTYTEKEFAEEFLTKIKLDKA